MNNENLDRKAAENFLEYSNILDGDYSVDYWSDVGIDEAVKVLKKFESKDWNNLVEKLPNRTTTWQTRCAETLSEASPENAIPILLNMLLSKQQDVLEASLDSLNSFKQFGKHISFSSEQQQLLETVSNKNDLIGRIALNLKD